MAFEAPPVGAPSEQPPNALQATREMRSPLLMTVVIVSLACGLLELVAAAVAISRLIRAPAVRSPVNVICTAIGAIPAMLFVAWYGRAPY